MLRVTTATAMRRVVAAPVAAATLRRQSGPAAFPDAASACLTAARRELHCSPLLLCRAAGTGSGGGGSSPHDSDRTDAFASQHFDVQDVDPDRLTHFFWDRAEEGGSPYAMDNMVADEMDTLLLLSEDNFENAWFIDPRDRRLLFDEYLYA